MSKPILVARLPGPVFNEYEIAKISEYFEANGINEDYNVLVVVDNKSDGNIKFECFNVPYTQIEFEELKERVLTILGCPETVPESCAISPEPTCQQVPVDDVMPYSPISFAYRQLIV